jgi:hypothetical protein
MMMMMTMMMMMMKLMMLTNDLVIHLGIISRNTTLEASGRYITTMGGGPRGTVAHGC